MNGKKRTIVELLLEDLDHYTASRDALARDHDAASNMVSQVTSRLHDQYHKAEALGAKDVMQEISTAVGTK